MLFSPGYSSIRNRPAAARKDTASLKSHFLSKASNLGSATDLNLETLPQRRHRFSKNASFLIFN